MAQSDFKSTASLDALALRAKTLRAMRQFFDERNFWEVQTPVLSSETVVDAHLDPIIVRQAAVMPIPATENQDWYLQTSPELLMKRLLASGAQAIYQIGPAFRWGESGMLHNPEFTMLEWYRVGDSMDQGVQLLADLVASLLPDRPEAKVVSYSNLFRQHLTLDPLHATDAELSDAIERRAPHAPADLDRDGSLEWLFSQVIQPQFLEQPVIVTHYPASQAALAQLSSDHPGTAERFELFLDGIELANGYGELLEAEVLRARIITQNSARIRRGAKPLVAPYKLLNAMDSGLPACTGCALGVDRFLMVAAQAVSLREVLAFPVDRV